MGLTREQNRSRMAVERATSRDINFEPPDDLRRRRACFEDPFEFMSVYFGWIFWQPFTSGRQKMVESIIHAARYCGDYAVADKRGGGKSGIALFTTLWLVLRGEVDLPLIIGKNQKGAENELNNLKHAITESPAFADDFPEICTPIIRLEDWASTARKQTVNGHRTKIGWEKDCLFLPTVPIDALPVKWPESEPSRANGQGIAVVGIDGKIRGFKRRNIRPTLALIDDIDDRESARSETQTKDRIVAIDQDTVGLAGSGKRVSRIMLCTTINDRCVAAIYTSKPSWNPQRIRAIVTMPERPDLRDEYIDLRENRQANDPDARVAHRFYLEHRDEIERGGVVDNPHDFVSVPASDGEPLEVSALQHYFNFIADAGWNSFNCELQNDPPKSDEDDLLILTAYHIQENCLSGYERRVVPPDTLAITVGADVQKLGLHWVAIGWNDKGVGRIIDYDFFEFMTAGKKAKDCEALILEGLFAWHEMMKANPFRGQPAHEGLDGEPFFADLTLIDTGWREESWNNQPVQVFCSQVGLERYKPSKGDKPYRRPKERRIKTGDNWHISRERHGSMMWATVVMNHDHWKLKVHEGFLADTDEPGCLRIFNKPRISGRVHRQAHLSYAKHITASVWDNTKLCWSDPTKADHYFDATYQAIVGRSICGIHVVPQTVGPQIPPPGQRPTAAQLAARR